MTTAQPPVVAVDDRPRGWTRRQLARLSLGALPLRSSADHDASASSDISRPERAPDVGSRKAEAPRKVIDAVGQRVGIGNLAIRRDLLEVIVSKDLRHRVRCDRLVGLAAHPGVGLLAEACTLQLLEETTKPAGVALASGPVSE